MEGTRYHLENHSEGTDKALQNTDSHILFILGEYYVPSLP